MSTLAEPRNDHDLQTAVHDELEWTPDVDSAGIGVAVEDGVVTLSGEVDDYSESVAARRAAQRVRGVTTLINALTVQPSAPWPVAEAAVAEEIEHALTWSTLVPDTVKASVDGHKVTLTGHVVWNFQREAAKKAVQHLRGVSIVENDITLTKRPSATDAVERIRKALTRNATLDASRITVTVEGHELTLTGNVRSYAEKEQARQAAWASPHVSTVDNRLKVTPVLFD